MSFLQEDIKVVINQNTLRVTRFIPTDRPVTKRILSLHGAGKAVRQRTFYLANTITDCGGEFVCFDFSGHGESTGSMEQSSLRLRRDEALRVAEVLFNSKPDVLMGNSMGGYIVVELLPFLNPEAIILLCPAMYDKRAFDVPFTAEFTSIIRSPQSFYNNNAAKYLASYKGRVMLAIGEKDDVIPKEVMNIYEQAASKASALSYVIVPGAPHVLHVWAASDPVQGSIFTRQIKQFIFAAG